MKGGDTKREVEIVGVVGNVQEAIIGRQNNEPHVYALFGQEYQSDLTIHLRDHRRDAARRRRAPKSAPWISACP